VNSETIHRQLVGRRCKSLVVYEAHGPNGLIDGVAMLVLGLHVAGGREEWIRVFFDVGGWSWTTTNEPVAAPEDRAGELRFPIRDVASTLGVAGAEIRLAELVPRSGDAGRFLLGFDTGAMVSVEHDGDGTQLQIIPPAA
jgi:hypothetical protein